jgi:hypothetical protein
MEEWLASYLAQRSKNNAAAPASLIRSGLLAAKTSTFEWFCFEISNLAARIEVSEICGGELDSAPLLL